MTRPLKFRVWNRLDNKWLDLQNQSLVRSITVNFDDNRLSFVDDGVCLYEQFTGLLDRNGKEIYEGDIVVVRNLHDGHEWIWNNSKQEPISQLISWQNCGFELPPTMQDCPGWFEVIGNIHEHGHLLR